MVMVQGVEFQSKKKTTTTKKLCLTKFTQSSQIRRAMFRRGWPGSTEGGRVTQLGYELVGGGQGS